MDKAHEVSPLIAMLDRSQGTLLAQTPHLVQDGLEPNTVFVDGPELDHAVWKCRGDLAEQRAQTRLEVCLRLRVSLDMAWARQAQTRAEAPQMNPAQLPADRSSKALSYPGGDGAPVPAVVLRSRPAQCRT